MDEDKWNDFLRNGFIYGGGEVLLEDFFKVVDRRIEWILMRIVSIFFLFKLIFICL